MAHDSGMMDWSPGGFAPNLSAPVPRPYYRDLDMPGGFPFTPSRPSTPVFERGRQVTGDETVYKASKRLCTTFARAANNVTIISMTSVIRSVRFMQSRMKIPRPSLRLAHRPAIAVASPGEGIQSSSPPAQSRKESRLNAPATTAPEAQTPRATISQEFPNEKQHSRELPTPERVNISSPFPLIKSTFGRYAGVSRTRPPTPDSSPNRQLAGELSAAVDDSDSGSNSFDGLWIPIRTPPAQVKPRLIVPEPPLASTSLDTDEWYHDGKEWFRHADLTGKSPSKVGAIKSSRELNLEDQHTSARQTRRALRKAKASIGDTAKFDIKPLSQEWEVKIAAALQNGHGRLQARDFQKIDPPHGRGDKDAWLNDESINEYLALVTKHANKEIKPKTTPRMHAFSTFFFTSLSEHGYQKVQRWAKRANLAGAALLNVEKIFIPINPSQTHWTLAVIEPRIKHITHYNSLGSGSKYYLETICRWLQGELGTGFVKDEWILDYNAESPQQTNSSDCGVFTVTTAKQLMLGLSPMTYGSKDIPTQRRRMIAELVNGELLQA